MRLIPSLDGGIYRFDGEGVEALPVTAQNLLHSSFKLNADTIFTGTTTMPTIPALLLFIVIMINFSWYRVPYNVHNGLYYFITVLLKGEKRPMVLHWIDFLYQFSPFIHSNPGGKATEVWGMALGSGRIMYICNTLGCRRNRTAAKPAQVLVVRRVTQTVRAVDPKSGDER